MSAAAAISHEGTCGGTPSRSERLFVRALKFVRFSHTIFAMPYALGAMLVAADGLPSLRVFLLIVLAMVFARTAAMAFNRVADWELDKLNPRTQERRRLLSRRAGIALVLLSGILFVCVTWFINPLCFQLSPLALAIVLLYSLTKRFTAWSHFFLGLALGIAPIGAWLAVRPVFELPPLLLGIAVLFWVAGFDIIYAMLDETFDQRAGLQSMVVKLGPARALRLAQWLHFFMALMLIAFGLAAGLGLAYAVALAAIAAGLVAEHRSAAPGDPAAINRAFFTFNAVIGALFLVGIALDVFI